jgi:hypothetical protein
MAAAVITSVLVMLGTGPVAQTFPADLPLAIICLNQKTSDWVVGYLETVSEDGTAIYGRGQLSATLNAQRVVEAPSNRPGVLDCFGQSVDQLRAGGRVIEFQRTE